MIDYFTDFYNLPFTVALGVALIIAVFEGVSTLFGTPFSKILNNFIEDFYSRENRDVLPASASRRHNPISLAQLIVQLGDGYGAGIGLLVLLLTIFGIIGLAIQSISFELFSLFQPTGVAIVITFVFSIPLFWLFVRQFSRLTSAVESGVTSNETLVGYPARITGAQGSEGNPVEATLRDGIGRRHLVMVEPEFGDIFKTGDSVILLRKNGSGFIGKINQNPTLED